MNAGSGKRLTADDRAVWQKVAQSVRPSAFCFDKETFLEAVNPPPAERLMGRVMTARAAVSEPDKIKRPSPLPDLDVGRTPGLDRRTQIRMIRGALPIEARLDLHGLSRDQAHPRLSSFIAQAYERGKRAVLIITGKGQAGGGVLKAEVPRWLNLPGTRDKILGFSYAQPRDGGDGALYVLVKRRRG